MTKKIHLSEVSEATPASMESIGQNPTLQFDHFYVSRREIELNQQVTDLAMLIKRIHRTYAIKGDIGERINDAYDYLVRKNLLGDILR